MCQRVGKVCRGRGHIRPMLESGVCWIIIVHTNGVPPSSKSRSQWNISFARAGVTFVCCREKVVVPQLSVLLYVHRWSSFSYSRTKFNCGKKKKNDTEEEGEDRTTYSRGRIAFNEFSFYAEYSYTSYTLRLRLLLETSTVSEKDRIPPPPSPLLRPS